jgi:hypothetical protein
MFFNGRFCLYLLLSHMMLTVGRARLKHYCFREHQNECLANCNASIESRGLQNKTTPQDGVYSVRTLCDTFESNHHI